MGIRERIAGALLGPELNRLQQLIEAASGSIESMLNEPGWTQIGGKASAREFSADARKAILQNARYYWAHDPKAGHAVRLYRDYVLGNGMTWSACDPAVREAIADFWGSPLNQKAFTGFTAQRRLIERLAVEGELFLAFHINRMNGRMVVRFIAPDEVAEVVTVAGDDEWPLYYRRVWSEKTWNYTTHQWETESKGAYYRDMMNADESHDEASNDGTEVLVMHVAINTLGKRGISILSRAIPWIKAHKGFMEDRVVLTLALATLAFSINVKGNAAAVDRLKDTWESEDILGRYNYGARGGMERAPGARALIANEALKLEQYKFDSGAPNAYTDARMLLHQVCAATGVFEHYLSGDPSTGNLATATAMELPMLKMFEAWQVLVGSIYLAVLELVINKAIEYGDLPGEMIEVEEGGISYKRYIPGKVVDEETGELRELDLYIDIDFPPIIQRDVSIYVSAVTGALSSGALGQSLQDPRYREAVRLILQALGVNNVEEIISATEQAIAAGDITEIPPASAAPAGGLMMALRQAQQLGHTDLGGRLLELYEALEEVLAGNGRPETGGA